MDIKVGDWVKVEKSTQLFKEKGAGPYLVKIAGESCYLDVGETENWSVSQYRVYKSGPSFDEIKVGDWVKVGSRTNLFKKKGAGPYQVEKVCSTAFSLSLDESIGDGNPHPMSISCVYKVENPKESPSKDEIKVGDWVTPIKNGSTLYNKGEMGPFQVVKINGGLIYFDSKSKRKNGSLLSGSGYTASLEHFAKVAQIEPDYFTKIKEPPKDEKDKVSPNQIKVGDWVEPKSETALRGVCGKGPYEVIRVSGNIVTLDTTAATISKTKSIGQNTYAMGAYLVFKAKPKDEIKVGDWVTPIKGLLYEKEEMGPFQVVKINDGIIFFDGKDKLKNGEFLNKYGRYTDASRNYAKAKPYSIKSSPSCTSKIEVVDCEEPIRVGDWVTPKLTSKIYLQRLSGWGGWGPFLVTEKINNLVVLNIGKNVGYTVHPAHLVKVTRSNQSLGGIIRNTLRKVISTIS